MTTKDIIQISLTVVAMIAQFWLIVISDSQISRTLCLTAILLMAIQIGIAIGGSYRRGPM